MVATTEAGNGSRYIAELRAMALLAWPMVLTNLAQVAMTATDVMLMGRMGPATLAAGTLGFNFYFAPMMFGLGLVMAVAPMAAAALGRRRHSLREVRRTVRQGFWAACIVALPIWLLLSNTEPLLVAMGQDPGLSADAAIYMSGLQWAILPFYFYVVLRSFLAALQRPGWALVVVVAAVFVNFVLTWALLFGRLGLPALGIFGAGLATTISSALMFAGLAAVVSIERSFRRFALFGRFWRADWPRLLMLVRLGLPIAGILVLEVAIFGAAALLMGLIDAVSLAAHAIAIQIASISFMVPMGIGQAVTVRVGRAHGAGDTAGARLAGWTAFWMGIGFMAVMALLMLAMPRTLISAFLDVNDPANAAVVALASTFLVYAAIFQIFDGAQAVGAGMLRGLHDTGWPMFYAFIGYWVIGLPLEMLLAFSFGFDGVGVWIGLCAGLAVVAVLLVWRWVRLTGVSAP